MKSEGSLSCSQKPATETCPNSEESIPRPHSCFFKIHFNVKYLLIWNKY
jgi:hypothetical protein